MKKLIPLIKVIAALFGLDWAAIAAFISVETGGQGFNPATGKIIIQFEPVWFKRKAPFAPSGEWSVNKVDVQSKEWAAFNDAFKKDRNAAMLSTSIGLGQIMGFHFARLGYSSVGEMWDDSKKGVERQIWQICKFIATDPGLQTAIIKKDWRAVASIYNGSGFRDIAKKYKRVPYDESMAIQYDNYRTLFET